MAILDNHRPSGPENWDKKDIKKATEPLLDEIYEYAKRLYAEGKQSVLVVLQGMDASGKDGFHNQPHETCVQRAASTNDRIAEGLNQRLQEGTTCGEPSCKDLK